MRWGHEFMLARAAARDKTFDGRFLTGVTSTGIYCLPSCGARFPNVENINFFANPKQAREAGLRPCLRCHPDLFYEHRDPTLEKLRTVLSEFEEDPSMYPDARALAAGAGVGTTKLHQAFRHYFHTTPSSFMGQRRVAAAGDLLLKTHRKVVDIAFEAGFENASTFYENFRKYTAMSATAYRRLGRETSFSIQLPVDFRIQDTVSYLSRDHESPTVLSQGRSLMTSVNLQGQPAVLRLDLKTKSVTCTVDTPKTLSASQVQEVHRVLLRILGLKTNPAEFERRGQKNPHWWSLLRRRQGLRIPQTQNVFEGLVWAIIGQQINLGFAYSLRRRLIRLAGTTLSEKLTQHPSPERVADLDYGDLTKLQFSRRKAEYLIDAARLIIKGDLEIEALRRLPATEVERRLLEVRGLGPWSTNYVMMRSCNFADCVPLGDTGLAEALQTFHRIEIRPTQKNMGALMEPFAPHRSLATFHLWSSLGDTP